MDVLDDPVHHPLNVGVHLGQLIGHGHEGVEGAHLVCGEGGGKDITEGERGERRAGREGDRGWRTCHWVQEREERAERSTKGISEGHITIARSGKKCAAIGETGIGCVRSKHFLT